MLGRHTAAGRRVALTALGALALTGATSAAAAEPPPAVPASTAAQTLGADRPPAALLRALERDLKLKPGQAAKRLVNEAEAGVRAGRLRNSLGDRFAGAWLRGRPRPSSPSPPPTRATCPPFRRRARRPRSSSGR